MDYQKAIESLRLEGGIEITGNPRRIAEFFEGIDVAISAMQELQEYKEIGTVKGYKDAIKAYDNCYFEKQKLEKELSDYKELGNFTEVKKAVDKQNSKHPSYDGDGYAPDGTFIWNEWVCPRCGARYEVNYDDYDYCPNCGQHIDWSEEE